MKAVCSECGGPMRSAARAKDGTVWYQCVAAARAYREALDAAADRVDADHGDHARTIRVTKSGELPEPAAPSLFDAESEVRPAVTVNTGGKL